MSQKETPKACPCGSEKPFSLCCEPYLQRKEKPKSARQMVRARYCAYALGAGNNREFLARTWHPATLRDVRPADLTNDNLQWQKLEIIRAEQKGDMARVEFKASYKMPGDDKVHVHHELSLFQRMQGVWLYLEGRVREE
jgi:SEC-C motif-containing protein